MCVIFLINFNFDVIFIYESIMQTSFDLIISSLPSVFRIHQGRWEWDWGCLWER